MMYRYSDRKLSNTIYISYLYNLNKEVCFRFFSFNKKKQTNFELE